MSHRVRFSMSLPHSRIVALPLLLALIALTTGCGRFRSADELVASAQTQFDAANYGSAMRDAKTALDKQPANAHAHTLVALVSLRLGNAEDALASIERARKAGADSATSSELRYRILLALRRDEDVLKDLATDTTTPQAKRLIIAAQAHGALGHDKEAGEASEQALAVAADDPEAILVRAGWLQGAGRIDEATQLADRLLKDHPDMAAAGALRGRLALRSGDAKTATSYFEHARLNAVKQLDMPDQLSLLVGLIEAQLEAGDVQRVEANLTALQARVPDAFITFYMRARVALLKQDVNGAADLLRAAVTRQPESVPARLLLGATLLRQGSIEQAETELSRLLAEQPDNTEARRLLAQVFVSRGDLPGARRIIDERPADSAGDAQLDWLSGSVSMMTGQTDEAIGLLEKSAAASPHNPAVQLDLAQAYLTARHVEQAQKLLHELPASERGQRGALLLVLADIWGKDPEQARQSVARIVADSPKDASLLVASGIYLLQSGSAANASDLFNRALAIDGRNSQARFGLAAAASASGDLKTAEEQLRKLIAAEPANERAYVALASLAFKANDRARARTLLEQAISANPAAVESRLRLAEMAFADRDSARADGLLEQALKVSSSRPNTLCQVGRVLMGASRFDEALAKFKEAMGLGVKAAQLDAATALVSLGRTSEAQDMLEAAVHDQPAALAPNALLVKVDLSQKRFDQALAHVAAFEKAGGSPASVLGMRGQALELAGRRSEALQTYEHLDRIQPSGSLAVRLYNLRRAANVAAPETVLVTWLKEHPQDAPVRATLAQHYQMQGNRTIAIAQYEQAAKSARMPEILNNLAWLYFETGDARALEMAHNAYSAAPASAEIADTYGWILLSGGRSEEALKILEAAARARPTIPDLQYHYASALARVGRKQEAVSTLRKVLTESQDFPTRREAETLLKSLG